MWNFSNSFIVPFHITLKLYWDLGLYTFISFSGSSFAIIIFIKIHFVIFFVSLEILQNMERKNLRHFSHSFCSSITLTNCLAMLGLGFCISISFSGPGRFIILMSDQEGHFYRGRNGQWGGRSHLTPPPFHN